MKLPMLVHMLFMMSCFSSWDSDSYYSPLIRVLLLSNSLYVVSINVRFQVSSLNNCLWDGHKFDLTSYLLKLSVVEVDFLRKFL